MTHFVSLLTVQDIECNPTKKKELTNVRSVQKVRFDCGRPRRSTGGVSVGVGVGDGVCPPI